ncbi:MAG: hypothetical protein V1773_06190 [bacterium]
MVRGKAEKIENFVEQIQFLEKSCREYDNGEINEIKRISVHLRNLLKDSKSVKSALEHLEEKTNLKYWDSSTKNFGFCNYKINNMQHCTVFDVGVYMGLVMKEISGINGSYTYHFSPLFREPDWQNQGYLDFSRWYSQVIYFDPKGSKITREKLILTVAEQDGGSHFDLKVNDHYYKFKQKDSLSLIVNGKKVVFENNPAFASLRQIAHELLVSIKNSELSKLIEESVN